MDDLIEKWKKEEKKPFSGWDFSCLKGRMTEQKPPWDYVKIAKSLVNNSDSLLDMGTGGGEVLSSLAPFPKHTFATEGYPPNVLIAKRRLKPLGVKVIDFSRMKLSKMPFQDKEFDLALNRHDAFDAKEIFRILKPNGTFLTQQVGKDNLMELIKVFGKRSKYKVSLKSEKEKLENAGFILKNTREWKGKTIFKDVGAAVYFLKAIPWVVPDFSVSKNTKQLEKLQEVLDKTGKLEFKCSRFMILARK